MNETYDAIVLGTGLKECILAGLLAKMESRKILQIDKNSYYGAESASLNLTNLWKHFKEKEGKQAPKEYGENRDWNVDLIPKFVMSDGDLVKLLFKTKVHHYLEWKAIDGTYVYQWDKGGLFSNAKGVIHKVPSNDKEALSSDLMGLFEKNRCRKFFQFIQDFDANNQKTWEKVNPKGPFKDIISKFGLEPNTTDFIGHAVALYTNDNFLEEESFKTIENIKLYMNSVGKYGESPFIYPIYGLSGLAEGFSRLCALYGGTYMLNRDCEEILYDDAGKFKGIKSQGEVAFGKILIADPTYIARIEPHKVRSLGKIVRCICILNHPIPKTKDMPSTQIIIPQKQVGRKNDIFIASLNFTHCICMKGYYVAIISTVLETNDPKKELKPAFDLIGNVLDTFMTVTDEWEPIDTSFKDNVIITKSFSSVSHFEPDTRNVLDLYKTLTGKELDLEHLEEEGQN